MNREIDFLRQAMILVQRIYSERVVARRHIEPGCVDPGERVSGSLGCRAAFVDEENLATPF
jgi:hypothetical protein